MIIPRDDPLPQIYVHTLFPRRVSTLLRCCNLTHPMSPKSSSLLDQKKLSFIRHRGEFSLGQQLVQGTNRFTCNSPDIFTRTLILAYSIIEHIVLIMAGNVKSAFRGRGGSPQMTFLLDENTHTSSVHRRGSERHAGTVILHLIHQTRGPRHSCFAHGI